MGTLPLEWTTSPLKRIVRTAAGGTPDSNNPHYWTDSGGMPWVAIGDMSQRDSIQETAKQLTLEGIADKRLIPGEAGTILFAMYASVGEVSVLETPAVWNQAILGLTASSEESYQRFIFYALKAIKDWLPVHYRSNTQNNLNAEQVGNLRVPLPSINEQRTIAEYLDCETAEIDGFIADEEDLISLLNERRAATVTHTVLYGLENSERLADQFVRIGQAFEESDIRVASASPSDLLSVSIHAGVLPWAELHDKEPRSPNLANYKVVRPGDIVLNRMRAFQGGLGEAFSSGVVSPDYMVMAVRERASSKYLAFLMKSQWFVSEMSARLRGIGSEEQGTTRTPRINPKDLANIRVPLPALEEQRQIANYLDHAIDDIDATIEDAREAIALSKERRTALISAAVTGKIDVRDHVNTGAEGAA